MRVPAVRTGKRAVISVRRGARPRLRVLRSAATAAVVLCGLVACATTSGGGSPYGTGDPTLAASNPGGGTVDPFLTDGRAVLRALDTIAAHSGKPLRVTSMNADRTNGLTIHVQEPKKHVNVDEYVITPDGTLSGPTPDFATPFDTFLLTCPPCQQPRQPSPAPTRLRPAATFYNHLIQCARLPDLLPLPINHVEGG